MTPDEIVALLRLIARQTMVIDRLNAEVEHLRGEVNSLTERLDDAITGFADEPVDDEPT